MADADSHSVADSHTHSIDTSEQDPLQDLTDEQLYQLVEETMCVFFVVVLFCLAQFGCKLFTK
jgi:hypothetical protein